VDGLRPLLERDHDANSHTTVSWRGQVAEAPENTSNCLKQFSALLCFFQVPVVMDALMKALERAGRLSLTSPAL
jgi:hypothetical protein